VLLALSLVALTVGSTPGVGSTLCGANEQFFVNAAMHAGGTD
jgi:hypothetical protein